MRISDWSSDVCSSDLVLGPDDTVGRGAALAAGQYITKDIYLEVITDARGYTATQLEISLTRALSLLSQAGGSGGSNLSIRYRKDYGCAPVFCSCRCWSSPPARTSPTSTRVTTRRRRSLKRSEEHTS